MRATASWFETPPTVWGVPCNAAHRPAPEVAERINAWCLSLILFENHFGLGRVLPIRHGSVVDKGGGRNSSRRSDVPPRPHRWVTHRALGEIGGAGSGADTVRASRRGRGIVLHDGLGHVALPCRRW